MNASEISLREVWLTYRKYWWMAVAAFIVGAGIGLFIYVSRTGVVETELVQMEFTIPVVARELPGTKWDVFDTEALTAFTNAWLQDAWTRIIDESEIIPEAHAYVVLRKDTFHFLIEGEIFQRDDLLAAMDGMADELYTSFVIQFIENGDAVQVSTIKNEACLKDAAAVVQIECFPVSVGLADALDEETFQLGKFLWVGERSEVSIQPKQPYEWILKPIAGGMMAEVVLLAVALLLATRKGSEVE